MKKTLENTVKSPPVGGPLDIARDMLFDAYQGNFKKSRKGWLIGNLAAIIPLSFAGLLFPDQVYEIAQKVPGFNFLYNTFGAPLFGDYLGIPATAAFMGQEPGGKIGAFGGVASPQIKKAIKPSKEYVKTLGNYVLDKLKPEPKPTLEPVPVENYSQSL